MRLPRRTPYTQAQATLPRLHALFYPRSPHAELASSSSSTAVSPSDAAAAGVALVALWQARGACPTALESCAALRRAQLLDELLARHMADAEGARSAYALALIR